MRDGGFLCRERRNSGKRGESDRNIPSRGDAFVVVNTMHHHITLVTVGTNTRLLLLFPAFVVESFVGSLRSRAGHTALSG